MIKVILLTCALLINVVLAEESGTSKREFTRFPIVVPTGWHYKEVVNEEVQSCFISKENININGKFSTGVSIYVYENVKNNIKMNGSTFILMQSAQAFAKEKVALEGYNAQLRGHGMAASYRLVDMSVPDQAIKLFCVLMEDIKNDQVISIVCESPLADFDELMKTVLPMLALCEIK